FAALVGGDDVGHDRLRKDHETAAAEALEGAEDDERPEVGGEGTGSRCRREQDDGEEEQVASAEHVTELAVDRHDDRRREKIRRRDPDLVLDAAELADNRGHGGRHDGLIQTRQQHARDERAEDRPDPPLRQQEGSFCGGHSWFPEERRVRASATRARSTSAYAGPSGCAKVSSMARRMSVPNTSAAVAARASPASYPSRRSISAVVACSVSWICASIRPRSFGSAVIAAPIAAASSRETPWRVHRATASVTRSSKTSPSPSTKASSKSSSPRV